MGVAYFYSWLKRKGYKGVLLRSVPRNVSSFSIDMNGIIHKCAQLVYAYGEGENEVRAKLIAKMDPKKLELEFYNVLSIKLQEVITQVSPADTLVMAVDGVAPQGKITQQRSRRFRSAMDRSGGIFDSNAISPGTDFMIRLDDFLQRWIVNYRSTLPTKVIYSSHMVPGEGEHKIMEYMRQGEIAGQGAHVLYGMDADLIMLSLLSPVNNIYLMREDVRDVISIENFKDVLRQEYGMSTAIQDFVVLLFMIGNDFLPHMPAFEDLDEALETVSRIYGITQRSIVENGEINWSNLAVFLSNMVAEEHRMMEMESTRDVMYPSRMVEAATTRQRIVADRNAMTIGANIIFSSKFNMSVFRNAWYKNALAPKGNMSVFEKLIPDHKFGVSKAKVIDMCQQYLIGMAWVYTYYSQGPSAINTDFVYRYHYTPLISDLYLVLKQSGKITGYLAHPDQVDLNPVHQLLAVLPLKSKDLLPTEVRHLMTKNSPIADMYPEKALIERDGKNAEWQGTVLLPFIDVRRIIDAVDSTSIFSLERSLVYQQAEAIISQRHLQAKEMDTEAKKLRNFLAQQKFQRSGGRGRGRGRGRDDVGRWRNKKTVF